MVKGGGQRRRQYCLNPDSSKHFLYFRAIQGHSGRTLVDPTWQDSVLLPDDSRRLHLLTLSIFQCGMIPGRKCRQGKAFSVFHSSRCTPIKIWKKFNTIWTNPEVRCTKYLESSQTYRILVQSEARSKKRISVQSDPIESNRSFQHTTCDVYRESGAHEDRRRFVLQSAPHSKVTVRRTPVKFATWTSESS